MTPPTSAERGAAVRADLLKAAAELIGELGWNAVTTRNLAARAGVRAGLVHYHFESLSDLLRKAAIDTVERMVAETLSALDTADSPLDGVIGMLGYLDGFDGRDPISLLISEANLVATRDELLRAELSAVVTRFHSRLSAMLRSQEVAEPEETATALMTMLDGFAIHKALNPDLAAAALTPVVRRMLTTGGHE